MTAMEAAKLIADHGRKLFEAPSYFSRIYCEDCAPNLIEPLIPEHKEEKT